MSPLEAPDDRLQQAMKLVLLAMLPWFLGLLVIAPVLGHASWHAYRHLVPPQHAG